MDPNTLNLDPDPGFWLNLDPDPDPWIGYTINFERKINFYLKSYIFCLHFTLYLHVWIRKAPEYGSNTDPDPQH